MNGAAGPNFFYVTRMVKAASAKEEYTELLKDLNQILGPPDSAVDDDGYPWVRWVWGDVEIGLRIAERFTEYVALVISNRVTRAQTTR